MDKLNKHWTSATIDNFVFQIAADFTLQLEKKLEVGPITNKELAQRLKVSSGRVSQVLNSPSNFTLRSMAEYARALGMKVVVVAYEDSDPSNTRGPINSEIFQQCWKHMGSPADFFELSSMIVPNKRFPNGMSSAANTDTEIDLTTAMAVQHKAANIACEIQ
jgi:transcriptional regulator with XRE-family HTH domain